MIFTQRSRIRHGTHGDGDRDFLSSRAGLAVPLVVAHSTAISAKSGLLIKDRTAFENSRKISMLVFDKTGTLTKGAFSVTRYDSSDLSFGADQILAIAAALEQNSEHPIAVAILKHAKALELPLPAIRDFKAITGKGIQAISNDKNIKVVSPGFLKEFHLTASVPECNITPVNGYPSIFPHVCLSP